eukprot:365602-Chlamydomonas_euryale.AAC.23
MPQGRGPCSQGHSNALASQPVQPRPLKGHKVFGLCSPARAAPVSRRCELASARAGRSPAVLKLGACRLQGCC